jgi:signal transduction histidine kinase
VSNYIAFLHGGIEKAGGKPLEDGNTLANQCLAKLQKIDNPEQFPPKLLLLLISANYLDRENHLDEVRARQLIAGVRQSFFEAGHRDIPLIGSSVAAVFYDRQIYYDGVLLVCLASRLLDITVSVATNVSGDPDTAVNKLINGLDIEHALDEYPRSLPNRTLLTFFPGTGTPGLTARNSTDKLHTLLLEKLTYQIPIVGGVSSANDQKRSKYGLQFVNQQTFTDALAACLIRSGLPLAISMAKGLESTGEILQVEKLSADERFIETFNNGRRPEDIFKDRTKPILLRDYSSESDVVRARWLPNSNGGKVTVLRDVRSYSALEVTTPNPKRMYKESLAAHELSLRRAKIEDAGGCLSFMCSGHLSYRDELGLDLPSGIKAMQEAFGIPHYVGGFYDGEVATDAAGAFTCGGWSIATMIFGDELSERTAVQGGFSTLATHGLALTAAFDLHEALKQSLELVYDLGFPGAMISLKMRDHNPYLLPEQSKGILVPMSAKGTRFNKVLQLMRQESIDGEMPLEVGIGDKPVFISHPPLPSGSGRDFFREAGIVNEYVLPLHDSDNKVFALLRVDIGTQEEQKIHEAVKGVLNSIAAIVGAAVNRISNWQENRIARKLDQTLKKSISANTRKEGLQQFIESTLDAFGLSMGHIRLVNPERHCLVLEAGKGEYFEAASASRSQVSFEDWSPSCEAFIRETTTIINDAPNNIAHKQMCEKYAKDPRMKDALQNLRSYANVPFKSENGERLGTINLLSDKKWLFTEYHERALAALSRRVGFLVEHLKTKEETKEAIQEAEKGRVRQKDLVRKVRFLRNISQRLELVSDIEALRSNDICNILGFATQSLCELIGADVAAFYLWDEDQQQYILRGQFHWKDERWLHAARYRRTDNWIGTKGLADKPRYVTDLFQYYKDQNYSEPSGRYAIPIFGRPLSPDFTVEAIAAPLRLAGLQIGVLTLYGVFTSRNLGQSKFYTTATWLLEEAVNRFAGLIGVLLDRQAVLEEERASSRRAQLLDVFVNQPRRASFEASFGAAMVQLFRASRIEFYQASESADSSKLDWVHGITITPELGRPEAIIARPAEAFVKEAARTGLVITRRRRPSQTDTLDPDVAATDGMIERAAVPLIHCGKVSGVIDFHWDTKILLDLEPFNYFSVSELEELGKMLGSLHAKHTASMEFEKVRKRREENQDVADTVAQILAQCAHKIEHLLGLLETKANNFSKAKSEAERAALIDSMPKLIGAQREWLDRLLAAAKKARGEKKSSCLRAIIKTAVKESGIEESAEKVHYNIDVREDLTVFANDDAIREVFVNIFNNSVEAMPDGGNLEITARRISGDEALFLGNRTPFENEYTDSVKIAVEDTGVGMDDDELQRIGTTHTTKKGHHGLGNLISEAVITRQGGIIKWNSNKGRGTSVEIILPARQTEE